jgi:Skp family chaperone for outer membrane proteins
MKIFIVNFEQIIKNYTPYQNSTKEIELEKINFTNKVDDIKREMEGIVSSSRVILLDQASKEQNAMRLRELQGEGMKLESEFRYKISQKQNDVLERSFQEISIIVNKWSKENNADMVINNNSVVFYKENFDVTDKIINILKENNLFSEWKEEEIKDQTVSV